ncbi:PucR family transcriptional regulator [Agrococcus sp. Marseille-P2731]|uniref:PucR family transcriptional regulator n=1 Tax=Agrococcus sp. Marseille-P2731 TaxID=1841862 RepID=UPI000931BA84|nr:helix-turn-helix domain-containing protein [Agrococcus sp. Marseille-P2731]
MTQFTVRDLLDQAERLRLLHAAGPRESTTIERVQIVEFASVGSLARGTLAVVAPSGDPAPYLLDIAIRQAIARELPALIVVAEIEIAETAITLARQGGVPVLTAAGARAADLAVAIDRLLSGGSSELLTRSAYAIERATSAAGEPGSTVDSILQAAGRALGAQLRVTEDPDVLWTENDAVCVGEVPIGRLVADTADAAVAIALPVVAALASRAAQRSMRDRLAPTQSRADLIVELVLAEAARVDAFVARAARLGLPLQLSHAVAWLKPTAVAESESAEHATPPRVVEPALELFALQLMEGRPELWHVAFVQDDMLIVCTEEHGAGDHQRRLREVAARLQERARELAGGDWVYTLGLGTPQQGAAGLRQSAAEARIAAETAIAANRHGDVALTDGTGLRRVLLDLYASPISRTLLDDVLAPLDALEPERAVTEVQTLLAYLSHNNSLASAGRQLNLHPNAVGYRLKRIRERLQLDLDDPDTRFSVELACRVRLLGFARR